MKAGYMKNMSDWNHNLKWLQTWGYFVIFSAKKIQPQQKSLKVNIHIYMVKLLK